MTTTTPVLDLNRALEQHRSELKGYCQRLLGSPADAEDAVQDTLVRGWRHIDRFEGRASLRSWLYRIATNVCHDMRRGRERRAVPVAADEHEIAIDVDPADVVLEQDAVRRAFVVALRYLPARQRAVVLLQDVLRWEAIEVARLLGTTPAAVHSMHQRARASLARSATLGADGSDAAGIDERALTRYVDAFQRHDVARLASLLCDAA
jgi:RNA polymerase sigma-70 factor (ECF subfamily)